MVNIKLSKLLNEAKKNMKHGQCFTCGKFKRPSKTIKKYSEKCDNPEHDRYYYKFQWEDYKKKYNIVEKC